MLMQGWATEGLAACGYGIRELFQTWRMIQQLPWQPHPYQQEDQTERDWGMDDERERERTV